MAMVVNERLAVKAAVVLTGVFLAAMAGRVFGEGWPQVGGDPGMSKYSAEDIGAGELQQVYVKRFCGAWSDKPPMPNYHYASAVVVRDGMGAALTNDTHKDYEVWSDGVTLTLFDWATGATTEKSDAPAGRARKDDPQRNYSLYVGEHCGEIDSHHYSNSVCWGADGRFYAKRGGDHFCVDSYDPGAKKWGRLEVIKNSPESKNWGGDTSAFLTTWKDLVIYHPGDTRDTSQYIGADISAVEWKAGEPGGYKVSLGPDLPNVNKKNTLRYCDYPKINAEGICVVAGQFYDDAGRVKMGVQARNVESGKELWRKEFDDSGRGEYGAAAPAYWWRNKESAKWSAYYFPIGRTCDYFRFVVTDKSYLFYHGGSEQTLEAVDLADGSSQWTRDLGTDHPVMGWHGDYLYVIGNKTQMKLDLQKGGKAAWVQQNALAGDAGYVMGGEDPVYRPMVVTDDTLWFIDGSCLSDHHRLVGMKTSDGTVVQTIDLAALVKKNEGESLVAVNDLMASQGKLGVLLGVKSEKDPHAGVKCNHIMYQDLYVFAKP